MARIDKFEDLVAWQCARELTNEIYLSTQGNRFSKDFALRDQVRRAAISIMANIAEGFERGGRAEFHQFLVVAKASCAEVRSHLYVALDVGYLTKAEFSKLQDRAMQVAKIIGGLRSAVQRQRDSGAGGRSGRP